MVILYDRESYEGNPYTLTSDNPNLYSWSNAASSIKVIRPITVVSSNTLNFGDLYHANRDGAQEYNENSKTLSLTLSNTQDQADMVMVWDIKYEPSYANIWPTEGSVDPDSSVTIEVWLNPTADVDTTFKIDTNGTDKTITLKATVHDTPTVIHIAPALGSNSRVNMGVDETLTFGIESGWPSFADIQGYQWQAQFEGLDAVSGAWKPDAPSTDAIRGFVFLDADIPTRTIYARMVDSNDVATEPVEIPVTVWELPEVLSDPYVGLVNQPMTLQATSDLDPTLSATGLTTSSKVGSGAGDFNGTSYFVDAPDFYIGGDMTVVAWVNSADPSIIWNRIIDFGNGENNNNVVLAFDDTSGKMRWGVRQGASTYEQYITTTEVFPANK